MPARPEAHPFIDLFDAHGAIQTRRMFGGFGMYVGGRIVGIIVRERIYLKTDDETRKVFIAEKCKPFTYQKRTGKGVSLRYYAIPERLYDEPDAFAQWVRQAETIAAVKPEKKKRATTTAPARRAAGNKRRRA
jgi:DNA transformation protein